MVQEILAFLAFWVPNSTYISYVLGLLSKGHVHIDGLLWNSEDNVSASVAQW